jgi:hypothetical protein
MCCGWVLAFHLVPGKEGVETGSFMRDSRTKAETPLHRAAAFGTEEAIQLLLDSGATIDAKDMNGDSPLTWASWHLRPHSILQKLCDGAFRIHPDYAGMDANLLGKPHVQPGSSSWRWPSPIRWKRFPGYPGDYAALAVPASDRFTCCPSLAHRRHLTGLTVGGGNCGNDWPASNEDGGLNPMKRITRFISRNKRAIGVAMLLVFVGALFRWEIREVDDGMTGKPITRYRGMVFPWQPCGASGGGKQVHFRVQHWLFYGLVKLEAVGTTYWGNRVRIEFSEDERNYIVQNPETDLLLTNLGMSLVEGFSASGGVVSVEATDTEIQKFLEELKDEFLRKINRVTQPAILRGLARRLLPDCDNITRLLTG